MVELVDTTDLKSVDREVVRVQVPFRVLCGCSSVVELLVANQVVASSNLATRSFLLPL